MHCFNPVKLWLTKYEQERRLSFKYMPKVWRYARYIYVPCGKCAACLSKRRMQWTYRLEQELKVSDSAYFITLTYEDSHLPWFNAEYNGEPFMVPGVLKKDVQDFLKRLRWNIQPFKVRYFCVSEYGPKTYRPHYHMILFNYPHLLDNILDDVIRDSWQNGFVRVDSVNPARINYVTSYCLDSSTLPEYLPKNFMLCSRRPGLGSAYLDDDSIVSYHVNNLSDMCTVVSDGKAYQIPMPRYYRSKLFNEQQANAICDKNIRLHVTERARSAQRQRQWLIKHGITPDDGNMQFYPGSPVHMDIQRRDEFTLKVANKCKMKKDL